MTYVEVEEWLFNQLPMYQNKGRLSYEMKLDPVIHFANYLNNPHYKFKSIHVGGTNGKGSSSHMLASVLQEAGYRVGLYTSPHLKSFRERIKINGKKIKKSQVIDFVLTNKDYMSRNQLSFFEMTVAMAFDHFAQNNVHIAIIEVGLGGRLDSTNIITPEVALITNIGFDHMDILGDTLPKIALEKAGIIKNGIPIVISEKHKETKRVFENIAAQKNAPLFFAEDLNCEEYKVDLLGDYQKKNIKGVLATLGLLKDFKITKNAIRDGLAKVVANTGLQGRWQVISEHPKIVLDTAHNSPGIEVVVKQLIKENYTTLHLVLGFVKGKNIIEILKFFPKEAVFYFTTPSIPRGLPLQDLEDYASQLGIKGRYFDKVERALDAAKSDAKSEDLIFVGGSTFVVADVV